MGNVHIWFYFDMQRSYKRSYIGGYYNETCNKIVGRDTLGVITMNCMNCRKRYIGGYYNETRNKIATLFWRED
jgi:hypothetical protein